MFMGSSSDSILLCQTKRPKILESRHVVFFLAACDGILSSKFIFVRIGLSFSYNKHLAIYT